MSSVLATPDGPAALARGAPRSVADSLGWRCLGLTLGFALVTPLVLALFSVALGEAVHFRFLVYEFAACLAIGAAAVSSALASDHFLRHRLGTVWRVSFAVLAAATGATLLIQLVDLAVAQPLDLDRLMAAEGKAFAGAAHRVAYQFAGAMRWSLVLVVLFELLEASRRARDQLHQVQLAALAAERDLVEGELRTMQARVDPDLLFDALVAIDRAYGRDVASGQAQLDALIRFLRAALPGNGSDASSVAHEQELVEAYVALARRDGVPAAAVDLVVDPDARREPMPAMLLLPLVKWALDDGTARRVTIMVRKAAGALAAVVTSDARSSANPQQPEILSVRERLNALYASGASLQVRCTRDARCAELTVPLSPRTAASPAA